MNLNVLLANQTIKTSDFLCLLGIGLFKLTHSLFDIAKHLVYVCTLVYHYRCKDTQNISYTQHRKHY